MISVIVPIYKVEDYLDECLVSIINQTYRDIEIICVDDCTLDNSINIVKKYMRIDSRIRLINHEKNKGLGGARNTGIDNARGEYIAFVDSDDVLDLSMLEKMERAIRKYDVDSVVCGIRRFIGKNEIERTSTFHTLSNPGSRVFYIADHKERLSDIWPSAPNKLYKASIIKQHHLRYQENLLYEDHYFYYSYFAHVDSFYFIDEPLYSYRASRPGSITSTLTGREDEVYTVLESLKGIFEASFSKEQWVDTYAKICFRLTWERQFNIWGNTSDWLKYTTKAERWLLERFPLDQLQAAVDLSIDRRDPFYRYLFTTGFKKTLFRIKLFLKKSAFINKVYSIVKRMMSYRSMRSYIKDLYWVTWKTHNQLDALSWPIWHSHDEIFRISENMGLLSDEDTVL